MMFQAAYRVSPHTLDAGDVRRMSRQASNLFNTKTLLVAFLFLSLAVSGCVSQPQDANGAAFQFKFLNGVTARQMATIDDRDNRVLIIDIDGNIYTLDPDGGRRQAITAGASNTVVYQQPTWAPDTNSIAWTQVNSGSDGVKSSLIV